MEGSDYMGNGGKITNPALTLIYPYYNNAGMLAAQIRNWNGYPVSVREQIEIIVVDDCSPREPAKRVFDKHVLNCAHRLYRINKDVRWNWIAARNLGAKEAKDGWLFMTDMDHMLTAANVKPIMYMIFAGRLDMSTYYTFERRDAPNLTEYKMHPNTYLIHRKLFWRNGGYDEEFSGYYGTDGYYRKLLDRVSDECLLEGLYVVRYPREVIRDASTTDYERKTEYDKSKKLKMREKLRKGLPQKVLTFPWERII